MFRIVLAATATKRGLRRSIPLGNTVQAARKSVRQRGPLKRGPRLTRWSWLLFFWHCFTWPCQPWPAEPPTLTNVEPVRPLFMHGLTPAKNRISNAIRLKGHNILYNIYPENKHFFRKHLITAGFYYFSACFFSCAINSS